MPNYKVEIEFQVLGDDPQDAARQAFERMAKDNTLPIRVSEIVSAAAALHRPLGSLTRPDSLGYGRWDGNPVITMGDAVYDVSATCTVEADGVKLAAQKAFKAMGEDEDFTIRVAEKVSKVVSVPGVEFTRASAFEQEPGSAPRP